MDMESPFHVTFDTNIAMALCVHSRAGASTPAGKEIDIILKAIRSGKIQPYVSEAALTFELFRPEDRLFILARYYGGLKTLSIPDKALNAYRGIFDLGFRVLHAPRIALTSFLPIPTESWAADIRFSREERLERYNRFLKDFKSWGPVNLKQLGAELVKLHKLDTSSCLRLPGFASPEMQMWAQGLLAEYENPMSFSTASEFLGHVRKLFSDWFDVDSVASHYGCGFDFYVTRDTRGIFSPEHRKSLRERYSVIILEPQELLRKIQEVS